MFSFGSKDKTPKQGAYGNVTIRGDEGKAFLDESQHSASSTELEFKNKWLLDVWNPKNICIVMSYFGVGFADQFTYTPVYYYMIDYLGASNAEQNTVITLMFLPWSFKLIYGLLSDVVPIRGQRRKPYLIAGWMIYGLSNLVLVAIGEPQIPSLAAWVLMMGMGYMLADVMGDTLVVERSRTEGRASKGRLQASAYISRYVGEVLGAVLGAVLFNSDTWGWGLTIAEVFALNAAVPLLAVVPFLAQLHEQPMTTAHAPELKEELSKLWSMAQLRSVWKPMAFVYLYNVLFVSNAAWSTFLIDGLDFSDFAYGMLTAAAVGATLVGLWLYKRFFFDASWRAIYLWLGLLIALVSLGQVVLEARWNLALGIPDYVFAMGDYGSQYLAIGVQFLPVTRMYLGLCPPGAEGMSYALLTTLSNVAGTLASDISTLLLGIWEVDDDTISSGDYSGMIKLTILTSVMQAAPLAFVWLLPKDRAEQKRMQADDTRSWWGGALFVAALGLAWVWTIVESFYEIIYD
mmetsp:Transcript_23931/g.41699  ORF Transcript_23931/g.41699 Transcript_23931/m.41699 type:complete len:517 (-) Transcript_23931:572-2122(-)